MYVLGKYINSVEIAPDYIYEVDENPIVKLSQPSNIKNISSVNGQDWLPDATHYATTMVSSQ